MSDAKILANALPSEIQAAQAMALLRFKNGHKMTLATIAEAMGRGNHQCVSQYIGTDTTMPAPCWIKLTARWPELHDLMMTELDAAEREAAAKQRILNI